MRNSPERRITILCPTSVPWLAPILGGIRRYARTQEGWHLISSPPTLPIVKGSTLTLPFVRGWRGDALVANSHDERELRYIRKMGIPAVNLSGILAQTFGIPRVLVNNFQAGRLAADHLLTRGLRQLAFLGRKDVYDSEQRHMGFSQRAAEAGVKCAFLLQASDKPSNQGWQQRIRAIAKWASSLPRPAGVFAVHDYRAQLLIEACYKAKLRIPEDIAVIGLDNDVTICEHSVPTLTSISCNLDQVGWEAAALLDRTMHGKAPPTNDVLLDPDGVVERQSTDMLYCADPLVRRAIDYMWAHLKTQFNIERIAQHTGVSKKTLETRFRQNLQSSPHEFLIKLRLQHAQALLQTPQKRTMEQTARECGFGTLSAFYAAFERLTGEAPGTFRKKHLAKNVIPDSL